MMDFELFEKLEPKELLQLESKILDELQRRDVIRTNNNPVGGYTEWLVSQSLGLTLAGNSEKGFDAVDKVGVKYEIKGRRVTPKNQSRQLSAIRHLHERKFDYLIAVVFDKSFEIILALKIPHAVVVEKSTYVKSTNSYRLMAEDSLKNVPDIADIGPQLK